MPRQLIPAFLCPLTSCVHDTPNNLLSPFVCVWVWDESVRDAFVWVCLTCAVFSKALWLQYPEKEEEPNVNSSSSRREQPRGQPREPEGKTITTLCSPFLRWSDSQQRDFHYVSPAPFRLSEALLLKIYSNSNNLRFSLWHHLVPLSSSSPATLCSRPSACLLTVTH